MSRRSDSKQRSVLQGATVQVTPQRYDIQMLQESSIEALVEDVEMNVGPIHTAVYNIGAQVSERTPSLDTFCANALVA